MPQAFVGQNSTAANGASGTATVSLRDLASKRTLVLVNGRRLMSGDPQNPSADLNFIPTTLVKQVEVLTGGASATYGSDAVAGVVNFILDTDFEGVKTSAQYSFYQHDNDNAFMQEINSKKGFDAPSGSIIDGRTYDFSIAAGSSFADGKGHASAYMTYREIEPITKANRDYTNCTLSARSSGTACGGSSTTPWGTFYVENNDRYMVDPDSGSFVPYGGQTYNYGPLNHIQRPDKTYTAGAFVNYEVNDSVDFYSEFMFMDDRTKAQIAPSGNFYRTDTINCDNPLLSANQLDIICTQFGYSGSDTAPLNFGRRNIEGGNRINSLGHTNYRMLMGLKGEINDTWLFDVNAMYSTSIFNERYVNDLNSNRIRNALDVITDPETGQPACRSAISGADSNCVPWDVFSKGGVTQEAAEYISTIAVATGNTRTKLISASVTGDLSEYGIALPGSEDGVSLLLGVEYREESLAYEPDEVFSKGLRAGSGGSSPAIEGGFDVAEIFAEAIVPIMQDKVWVDDLSMELAYRYSNYNLAGGTNTYKVGLSWAANSDIKFRLGYNQAVRVPNALELFDPQTSGLGGATDLCSGENPEFTLAECLNTGVTAEQYGNIPGNPADQYNTLEGGNVDLDPEQADTYTVGAVFTPTALPEFNMSIDWYDITITDAIGTLGADDVINTCARNGDPELCSLIKRDSAGTLWRSTAGYTETIRKNTGELHASGIDLEAQYSMDTQNWGSFNVSLRGTKILKDEFKDPLVDYDCAGYFGSQSGTPKAEWQHKMKVLR
ncbi:TonB-dependent receptor [Pseudoalteromonas sp. SCSIO 43088]|uniref:TonB-dependent receptor plug domain-containing protein n=1 Tax=Pseudoalteromonas sp. SCSIO 43088 TaxID=2822846 RepID=UPI00202B650C|nr:TonB-dependent receptor [Pseudoalteromonas sp. SCSIO 43088]URQ85220.1 TonB-dependent receptor [Pseudoalteromonas sp. SCSIO 43088]